LRGTLFPAVRRKARDGRPTTTRAPRLPGVRYSASVFRYVRRRSQFPLLPSGQRLRVAKFNFATRPCFRNEYTVSEHILVPPTARYIGRLREPFGRCRASPIHASGRKRDAVRTTELRTCRPSTFRDRNDRFYYTATTPTIVQVRSTFRTYVLLAAYRELFARISDARNSFLFRVLIFKRSTPTPPLTNGHPPTRSIISRTFPRLKTKLTERKTDLEDNK